MHDDVAAMLMSSLNALAAIVRELTEIQKEHLELDHGLPQGADDGHKSH